MEQTLYSDSDKQPAIDFCKQHIETNGYCAIKYAVRHTVPGKHFKNEQHERAFYNSISSLITRDGKYREKNRYPNGNIDIELDPGYKRKGYFERYPFREKLVIAFITAALAFGVNFAITIVNKRSQVQTDKEQDRKINALQDSINSLKMHIDTLAK